MLRAERTFPTPVGVTKLYQVRECNAFTLFSGKRRIQIPEKGKTFLSCLEMLNQKQKWTVCEQDNLSKTNDRTFFHRLLITNASSKMSKIGRANSKIW